MSDERQTFTCPVCDMTSGHPKDVENGYCGNCHAFTRPTDVRVLTLWVIYDRPLDAPDHAVVRGSDILRGFTEPFPHQAGYLFRTVDDARRWIEQEHPEASVCIPRDERDEPQIVETWL